LAGRPAPGLTTTLGGAIAILLEPRQPVEGCRDQTYEQSLLEITAGGHANSVARDSENGAAREVEVTKPNGDTVDVRLDEGYQLGRGSGRLGQVGICPAPP
jgi:hypothetical protein